MGMPRNSIFIIALWLITGFLALIGSMFSPDESSVKSEVNQNLQRLVEEQHAVLENVINQFSNLNNPYDIQIDHRYPIRVYDNGELIYWNSNSFIPDYSNFRSNDSIYFHRSVTSYVINRKTIAYHETGLLEFYGFIPIYENFGFTNRYLTAGFNKEIFSNHDIDFSPDGIYARVNDHVLFQYELILKQKSSVWTIVELIFLIAIISSMVMIYQYLLQNHPKWVVIFLLAVVILRLVQLRIGLPTGTISFFFDPKIYTSSWLLPTIGDLIINLSILFILSRYLFAEVVKNIGFNRFFFTGSVYKWIGLFIVVNLAYWNGSILFDLAWNLMENSQVTLDITSSIDFDLIRVIFYLSVTFYGIIFFHINHFSFQYFTRLARKWWEKVLAIFFFGGFYLLLVPKNGWIVFVIISLLWFFLYVTRLTFQLANVRYLTFYYYLLIAIAVATTSSSAVYKHYERDELISKRRFATNLLLENDILAEYYLNEVVQKIKEDPNIRSRFYSQLLARQNLKDKVMQLIPPYLNKFEIQVHIFDQEGFDFTELDARELSYWDDNFRRDEFATSYKNIYFVNASGGGRDKYLAFVKLEQFNQTMGHLVLELTVKKYIPSSVFPSLLVEKSPQESVKEFDYAIYKGENLLLSQGSFAFEEQMSVSYLKKIASEKKGLEVGSNHLFAMELSENRILLIVSDLYTINRVIGNISFFFIISLVFIGITYLILRYTHKVSTSSLANRIQLYIGLSFLLPTLIISIAILNILNRSYSEEIDRNYQKSARNLAENLVIDIRLFKENLINSDQFVVTLIQASNYIQTDLIIYDENGKLMGTSRPEVFRNQLLSDRVNPDALRFIKNQLGPSLVLEEEIDELNFKTAYTGIYDFREGNLLGILALPYFDARSNLNRQQIEVFSNLIIFFSLVFIITILLGNVGIQNLIIPIKSIAERLSKTNLIEQEPKPLEYNTRDEIGLLVKEYNLMVKKLDESRQRLAQIQKETAWKEIARQVAHEIKNPLTPMRLKVQQMQREIDSSSNNYRMLSSLLTQIDSLSSIADSFSAFAKMPAPQNMEFNLSELISDIVRLYQGNDLVLKKSIEEGIFVYADPKLFSQILNNLLLNAIQAIKKEKKVITVELRGTNGKVLCSVRDNGEGIPENIKHKIFTPYFSTKEKGSGIGLALAKKGIEQANGSIWFESKENEGTTFYFMLPTV